MALRGNLRDFSLPDVFQLVTFSRKTGVLRIVRSDEASGSVWFNEGEVFFASSNWRTRPLGERLVNSQRITPQALARALELRSLEPENGRRLGQILVDEAYITQKILESFVQEQIQDTIFDLMRWDEGEFDFEPMPTVVEEDIGLSVSIENIVMEGSRRLEEWARIKKKIPSMDVVFKMATAPGEGSFEISLKPMEWELLVLVDGSRSVAELAAATSRTDFEVARVVYGLFSAGLLEFASDEEVERNRRERIAREAAYAAKLSVVAAAPPEPPAATQPALAVPAPAEIGPTEATVDHGLVAQVEQVGQPGADVVPVAPAYSGPAEVPQFLDASGVSAPTDEDQAVLEEFMGSLLGVTLPQPAVAAPKPPKTAYVPAEEPAFIGATDNAIAGDAMVPSVEELLGLTPSQPDAGRSSSQPAEPSEAPSEPVAAPIADEPVAAPIAAEPAAAPIAAEPAAARPEESASDTRVAEAETSAADLPLAPPAAPEQHSPYPLIPVAPLPDTAAPRLEITDNGVSPEPAIPMSLAETPDARAHTAPEFTDATAPDYARDLMALGLGELPAEEPVVDAPVETPGHVEVPQLESSGVPSDVDVSGIIASLGSLEPEPIAPASSDRGPDALATDVSDGFDRDLIEEATDQPASGVISTDGFLSSGFGGGLSSGLNDELSALTGAERRGGHTRPQASVKPLAAETGIRRDPRVDRETLLKIIDGIERL